MLRKIMLVFMGNIFIYSKMVEEYEEHFRQVFNIMRSNKFYAMRSKSEP